jgi:hypothetical protein
MYKKSNILLLINQLDKFYTPQYFRVYNKFAPSRQL